MERMPKLKRNSTSTQIWDKFVGSSRDTIPLTHLPTKRVVLQRYRGVRVCNENAGTRDSKFEFTIECWHDLKNVWDAARVITIEESNGKKKIKELVTWFEKISSNKRYLVDGWEKANGLERELNSLFDIAPRNIMEQMKSSLNKRWKEDYDFYLNQQTYPQTQVMVKKDQMMKGLEKRREERKMAVARRQMKEKERKQQDSEVTCFELVSEDEEEDDDVLEDPDWQDSSTPPKKPDSMTVQMNLRSVFEETTDAAVRARLSASAHLELVSSFVNRCTDTTTEALTASLSTCKRQRERSVKKSAKRIRTSFSAPKYPTVHFDGKVVKHLSGVAHDHEAVCLSAPTDLDQPQFLGAPLIQPATGENTAAATISMLDGWDIDVQTLFAAVWDTASVNSGVDNGACACLERQKGSALLWCACRHHIYEVHMTHVFDRIRGKTHGECI